MNKNLSIILPAYNEVENIERVANSILEFVPTITQNYEIIIVDDGSRDGTGKLIDKLAKNYNQIVALHHLSNKGYGAALRSGFKAAKAKLIFFTDGDGQFDIRELAKLMALIKTADIICGYRIRRADYLFRRINAGLYNLAIRLLFNLSIMDIDCAFKLFKREVIQSLNLKSSGAFINAEFLVLAKKKGYTIRQVGVSHYPRKKGEQTGNNVMVVFRAMVELVKFWDKMRRKTTKRKGKR
ncbi:glycosyltransferase family 2 protein [Patescibacteria group bacterium]|nr:glycosyltransferase family 2 protein [Patescibacteria group bacterium]